MIELNEIVRQYPTELQRVEFHDPMVKALIQAADRKKLSTRNAYDCEHMLFFKNDIKKLRMFTLNIENQKMNLLKGL